jgi:hypothetical protein
MHTLDKALDSEIKILSAIDITQAIIDLVENQVRLKALTIEVEQLKRKVSERDWPSLSYLLGFGH